MVYYGSPLQTFRRKNFLKILIIRKVRKVLYKLFRVLFQRFQPLPLEDQHVEHANGDGSVGEVENGAEEDEMPVGTEEELRQPRGVFSRHVNNREIEHVDHAPVQPAGITTAVGEHSCDLRIGALAEDAPIEHAVDDVAHGSRRDEGDAKQHAKLGLFLRQSHQHPEQSHDGHNAEQAERQLQETAATHPAKGHAVVLDEQQNEPMPDDRNLLTERHTRLDPDLEDLVED